MMSVQCTYVCTNVRVLCAHAWVWTYDSDICTSKHGAMYAWLAKPQNRKWNTMYACSPEKEEKKRKKTVQSHITLFRWNGEKQPKTKQNSENGTEKGKQIIGIPNPNKTVLFANRICAFVLFFFFFLSINILSAKSDDSEHSNNYRKKRLSIFLNLFWFLFLFYWLLLFVEMPMCVCVCVCVPWMHLFWCCDYCPFSLYA